MRNEVLFCFKVPDDAVARLLPNACKATGSQVSNNIDYIVL
jgi:hypothetical protein